MATVYTTLLLRVGGAKFLLLSAVIYAPGILPFALARRERKRRIFGPIGGAVCIAVTIAVIYGLATGATTI